jgi:hypothetical protein
MDCPNCISPWKCNGPHTTVSEGEPVVWVGCGECDPIFRCYEGKAHCLRLEYKIDAYLKGGK